MTDSPPQCEDEWKPKAALYSSHAARLTQLHGADLVTLITQDILQAKTIIDVGCGTGAFAHAYLQQFPDGVPGQTLILTDLSKGMLDKARETVKPDANCQTKIVFQEEDATKLEGIPDDSVDLVVSLFGVFLIPDQQNTCNAIRRVLTKPSGVLALTSWQYGVSADFVKHGFGVCFMDAFELVNPYMDAKNIPIKQWATEQGARSILCDQYKMADVYFTTALHTMLWEFNNVWSMTKPGQASQAELEKAKDRLVKFMTQDGKISVDKPLLLSSASNLFVARCIP